MYSITVSILIREVIIPIYYNLDSGHIPGDPILYYELAINQVENILKHGFSEFSMYPGGQGISGIFSLVYIIFPSIWGMVVLNALLHAVSTILIIGILRNYFSYKISVIATIPFILSPYMSLWFSQVNKDSIAVAGSLFILFGIARAAEFNQYKKLLGSLAVFGSILIGVLFIWSVRPYLNQVLFPVVLLLILLINFLIVKKFSWQFALSSFILVIVLWFAGYGGASGDTINKLKNNQIEYLASNSDSFASNNCLTEWTETKYIPNVLDQSLFALVGTRCNTLSLLSTNENKTVSNSFVDENVSFRSSYDVISYMPQAASLGILSPLPSQWSLSYQFGGSLFFLIASVESFFLYVFCFAIIWFLYDQKKWTLIIPLVIIIYVCSIYAVSTPLIGTLYRYRYAWYMVLFAIGFASFLFLISKKFFSKS